MLQKRMSGLEIIVLDIRFPIWKSDDMANVLKTWRTQENKLTKEVAEAIGVTPAMWSRWENGKRKVPPAQAIKIESILGIPKEQTSPEIYAPKVGRVA